MPKDYSIAIKQGADKARDFKLPYVAGSFTQTTPTECTRTPWITLHGPWSIDISNT